MHTIIIYVSILPLQQKFVGINCYILFVLYYNNKIVAVRNFEHARRFVVTNSKNLANNCSKLLS